MALLDYIFPGYTDRREAARLEARRQLVVQEGIDRCVQRELHALAESTQNLGNPWQNEYIGLTPSQAFAQGMPYGGIGVYDGVMVASSDALRNEVLQLCRVLYDTHPHAKAIIEAQVAYIVGATGWTVEPMPLRVDRHALDIQPVQEADIAPVGRGIVPVGLDPYEPDLSKAPREREHEHIDYRLKNRCDAWYKRQTRTGYYHPQLSQQQFQEEAFRRCRRDGEVFIFKGHDPVDGHLSPRFLDPMEIVHPTGAITSDVKNVFDPDACGIRVDEHDHARVLGYWYRPLTNPAAKPIFIHADRIKHKKFGVDSTVRRGLPCLFVIRHFLRHFDTWLGQSLKHQNVQSRIAILRSWTNTTPTQLASLVSGKDVRRQDYTTPAGNSLQFRTTNLYPVVDAPANMQLQGFTPGGNYSDSEILARRVLLACAAGENLSEAMVTADGSNANYASTRLTTFIPFEGFKKEKRAWGDDWSGLYEDEYKAEAAAGRLPPFTPERGNCNVKPAELPNLEGEVVTPTAISQYEKGLISKRTAQEMVGADPEMEDERQADEEREQQEREANAALPDEPLEDDGEVPEAEPLTADADPELTGDDE